MYLKDSKVEKIGIERKNKLQFLKMMTENMNASNHLNSIATSKRFFVNLICI